jgi:general stress protein YciG
MNVNDEKRRQGFDTISVELQREISAKGGKAAHAYGRAHEFTAEEARAAGRKGGASIGKNREHMAAIGRLGGLSRSRQRAAQAPSRGTTPDDGASEGGAA